MKKKTPLSEELIKLRKDRDLTQLQLCDLCDNKGSIATIRNAEGNRRRVGIEMIEDIYREALNLTDDEWIRVIAAWVLSYPYFKGSEDDEEAEKFRHIPFATVIAIIEDLQNQGRLKKTLEEEIKGVFEAMLEMTPKDMRRFVKLVPAMVKAPDTLTILEQVMVLKDRE